MSVDSGNYRTEERRKFKRIKQQFIIKLQVLSAKPSVGWNMVPVRNIGADGLLFNYDEKLDLGTPLNLTINFPMARKPIPCTAKVLRVNQVGRTLLHETAAHFTQIDDSSRELINNAAEAFYSKKTGRIED